MQKSDSHNLEIQSGVYGLGCHLVSLFVYCIPTALAPPTCHVLRCQDQLLQIVKQIQSLQSVCNLWNTPGSVLSSAPLTRQVGELT
jgi:hypothetical protein